MTKETTPTNTKPRPRQRRRRPRRRPTDNYRPPFNQKVLTEPIHNLNFRMKKTLELLQSAGINTVGEVLRREEKDFYRISTFNKRNLLDVKDAVKKRNLHLKPSTDKVKQEKNQSSEPAPKSKERATRQRPKATRTRVPRDKYVKVQKNGLWGFSDRRNNVVITPQYDEVFSFKEDLCCVEKDSLFGFIDRQGNQVVPIEYECALSFSQGYACVYKNNKCGYIDKENNVVIDFLYDAGTPMEDDNCRVKLDGKWGELRLDNVHKVRWIN